MTETHDDLSGGRGGFSPAHPFLGEAPGRTPASDFIGDFSAAARRGAAAHVPPPTGEGWREAAASSLPASPLPAGLRAESLAALTRRVFPLPAMSVAELETHFFNPTPDRSNSHDR